MKTKARCTGLAGRFQALPQVQAWQRAELKLNALQSGYSKDLCNRSS